MTTKPSRFNIMTTNEKTGGAILFNTLYGSTVSINPETLPSIVRLLGTVGSQAAPCDEKIFSSLVRGKFIVEESRDELEIIRNRKRCGIDDKNRVDVIIMPNLDCNFSCPYCYEKHDTSHRMTADVEHSIKTWLEGIVSTHKVVLLNWFGGEPLLSHKTIMRVGAFVKQACENSGTSLLTNITTNGYAFTQDMVKQFIALGINSYQITVDGPPEIHNRTRVLKSGRGSFDRIHANIELLATSDERVKISLRVNYNHKNIHYIPELLAMFPEKIRPQLRVVYEPIFGNKDLSATNNMEGEEISSAITEYYEIADSMGFDVVHGGLGVGKLVYCYAERKNQYIVNYNGDIFKCSVSEFTSNDRVGYINDKGEFLKDQNSWDAWFNVDLFEEQCEACVFLPLCMGGCRKDRFENRSTGSYCHLVPTNTSYALKSIAFGSFNDILKRESENLRKCADNLQSQQ